MRIEKRKVGGYGIQVFDFNPANINETDIILIKNKIYEENIVVLKNQNLSPNEFVNFGKKFGTLESYYESMYHHPDEKLIFVSSNIPKNEVKSGVPKTGKFWHSDYGFMSKPFAITITYPQVVPKINRGTYFIDMHSVYEQLPSETKALLTKLTSKHSVRRYFKIRPQDIYKPINELLREIEEKTPEVVHPTVVTHPFSKEKILYINEAFTTSIDGGDSINHTDLLHELLAFSGQLDKTFLNSNIKLVELEEGDIILWDNRKLVHHAKHSDIDEPTETFRLSVYDEFPFSL